MKAISANPQNISEIFDNQKNYIIPEFQRPYSWKEDAVIQLFDDITDFYEEHINKDDAQDTYYLGNIVYFRKKDLYFVIDGQQRLTTLALFLKALFSISTTSTALEQCLKRQKPLTTELLEEVKIETRVLGKDKEELTAIILKGEATGQGLLSKNYNKLLTLLTRWIKAKNFQASEVQSFISMVLKRILLLPILCDSQDDALTIFDTLNNRGLPLGDEDIFKAHVYKNIHNENEKIQFASEWNDICDGNGELMRNLFRFIMHIERAKDNIISKEIALRKYFDTQKKDFLSNWKNVIASLKVIHDPLMEYEQGSDLEKTARVDNLWRALNYIPHVYCRYPPYVFWAKYAKLEDGLSVLPKNKLSAFEKLLIRTIKYYYTLALSTNTVNSIKDTTFKVCADIWHEKDYLLQYKEKYKEHFQSTKLRLDEYHYRAQKKGLVYLLSILNTKQNQTVLQNYDGKIEVEHILPQKGGYNNYNGWTEEQYFNCLNSIGNLVLFEKTLNIRASNDFFAKKKIEYRQSIISEARDLVRKKDWTYQTWKKRQTEKNDALIKFFEKIT